MPGFAVKKGGVWRRSYYIILTSGPEKVMMLAAS
jgi:hypothetical protein